MPPTSSKPRLILVGSTATGKSDVAHIIARRQGWGIVSADAMMVYRGMDIGTAKPTPRERNGIAYAGLDLADPSRRFNAHDFASAVERELEADGGRHTWIVVGGTGLYVQALLGGLPDVPGPNEAQRREAEVVLAGEGMAALKAWCKARASAIETWMPETDLENPRRWIRALERGGPPDTSKITLPPGSIVVGLRRTREDLEDRITRRVDQMYRNGLIDEVRTLRHQFGSLSDTAAKAIGYAEAMAVMDGKMTENEAKSATMIRTRQYAKRQTTWFRHQFDTRWIDVAAQDPAESVAARVLAEWERHG